MTSFTIPETVTSIGYKAFECCTKLRSIDIPEGVTTIEYATFFHCDSLTSITIPESVRAIRMDAFYGCGKLTSIDIPESTTTIEEETFRGCKSLTSITIPSNVASIGDFAFRGCTALRDVTCLAERVPSTGHFVFEFIKLDNVTLHVPASSIELYRAANPWKDFGSIVALTDGADTMEQINTYPSLLNAPKYDLNGRYTSTNGLYIKDGKKYLKR